MGPDVEPEVYLRCALVGPAIRALPKLSLARHAISGSSQPWPVQSQSNFEPGDMNLERLFYV
ncbi:hypothetical protein BGZ63DRAFT_371323 [Mariannaea sp. PMI_226]|nr:hypothetical protein BGZ63DRAFT_371323 [Mariannaea sp. PMI_226]